MQSLFSQLANIRSNNDHLCALFGRNSKQIWICIVVAFVNVEENEGEQKNYLIKGIPAITKCRRVESEYLITQNTLVYCVVQATDKLGKSCGPYWLGVIGTCLNAYVTKEAG